MEEKEFFMPGFEKEAAINKWKEFCKAVNNGQANKYSKPVEYFNFNYKGKHLTEMVNKPSTINNELIIAIVQCDNGMYVHTRDSMNKINIHLIRGYNRESYNCFKEI